MAVAYKPRSGRSSLAGTGARNSFLGTAAKKPTLGNMSKSGLGKPGVGKSPKFGKPGFKAPAAPPTASKPSVAPVGQAAQPDALYNDQVATAEAKGETKLSQLGEQERGVKFDFGIEDPTNPFSRVNGLKSAFLARQKAASAGLASQGQLYSGAHERAVTRTRRDEEEARAQLRQQYDAAINQIGADKAGVKYATEEERNQAFEDWLARAPEADAVLSADDEAAASNEAVNNQEPAPPQGPPKGLQEGASGVPGPPKGVESTLAPAPAPTGQSPAEKARAARQAAKKAAAFKSKVEQKRVALKAARQEQAAKVQAGPSKGAHVAVKAKAGPKVTVKAHAPAKKGRR